MVQTYGVIGSSAPDTVNEGPTGEASALLGGDRDATVKRTSDRADGHASIVSCISNLSNTIIGSGVYPYSLKRNTSC